MREDPIVADVRRVREELAAQFNFDIGAIFADIRKRQVGLGSRLVRHKDRKKANEAAAPDRDSTPLHPGR